MQPIKCKRKILVGCILAFVAYLLLFPIKMRVKFDGIIKNTEPEKVGEYVADFSNMKNLNPTIIDFSVTSETGNYEHWEYSVVYTEYLHNVPAVTNKGYANYQVKPFHSGEFVISSVHSVCFLHDIFCLKSWSHFTFRRTGLRDTYCLEEVAFECPRMLTKFCESEVMYQRTSIFNNLIQNFGSKEI